MKSLLTPGICLVAVAVLLHTGLVAPSATIVTYAFYTATIVGLLLAWRFHSSRIFFALLVLFLSKKRSRISRPLSLRDTSQSADPEAQLWPRLACSCLSILFYFRFARNEDSLSRA